MIVTQHSGDGKANQYYLRGFNLDHGTDFATSVGGHAGQHADPRARAGLYRPQLPDSGAGLAGALPQGPVFRRGRRLRLGRRGATSATSTRCRPNIAALTDGSYGYGARCSLARPKVGPGRSGLRPRAPARRWAVGQSRRLQQGRTACCATRRATAPNGFNVTAMAYDGQWNSTDQIPQRAVDDGADRPLRHDRSDRRRPVARATACPASGSSRRATSAARRALYAIRLEAATCSPTSPTSSTTRSTATSSSRPTTASSLGGPRSQHVERRTGAACRVRTTVGLQLRRDRLEPGGALQHRPRAAPRRRRARTTVTRLSTGTLLLEHDRVDATGSAPSPVCAPTTTASTCRATIRENSGKAQRFASSRPSCR